MMESRGISFKKNYHVEALKDTPAQKYSFIRLWLPIFLTAFTHPSLLLFCWIKRYDLTQQTFFPQGVSVHLPS